MTRITPLLLCGGSGTRLWPLSRKSFPKQFARLTGAASLFQQVATRFSGPDFSAPVVVTNADFRFIVLEQLAAAALTPQSHVHRSEHRIVASGTAKVTIGETTSLVTENQSVYIPLGAEHRLENLGKLPMVLIEVQTGAYLGEDDITRYEDVYARSPGAKG